MLRRTDTVGWAWFGDEWERGVGDRVLVELEVFGHTLRRGVGKMGI